MTGAPCCDVVRRLRSWTIEADAKRPDLEYPLPPYDIDVATYAAFS